MSQAIPPEWSAVRRVLAIRLDNLGDMLLATPALRAIKEALPGVHLGVLASPAGAQAAALNPDVDEVIVYRAPWVDPWRELPHDPEREQRMVAELRERAFDAAVIFTSFRQSSLPAAYLCYLAGIPLRLGASIDGSGSLLTTRHKHPEASMHEVERGLDLVGAVGLRASRPAMVLEVPPAARRQACAWCEQAAPGDGPLIVVHPGCTMPARTYPWEGFAQAADMLAEGLGARIVLTGAGHEEPLVTQIRGAMRHRAAPAAGVLSFPELCALVEAADLVITNNTGPMHLAATLGTPVVALFALTNPPEQWRPWGVPHRLLYHDVACRICYSRVCPTDHGCLRRVTPAQVAAASSELLAARGREVPA